MKKNYLMFLVIYSILLLSLKAQTIRIGCELNDFNTCMGFVNKI